MALPGDCPVKQSSTRDLLRKKVRGKSKSVLKPVSRCQRLIQLYPHAWPSLSAQPSHLLWCPAGPYPHAAASSFAAGLLFEDLSTHHNLNGDLPPLGQLLCDTSPAVPTSRLPEEGLDLHPPYQKHIWRLETGQYKHSLRLEAAQ